MTYHINIDLDCIDEDGKPYKYIVAPCDYTLFAICNASYYGGGFCPAPNSVLDDGLLDFALCHPVNAFQAQPMIPEYSKGNVDKLQNYFTFGKVVGGRIWTTDGGALLGNCDGENFDYSEVNFKVLPKSLKLCFIKD